MNPINLAEKFSKVTEHWSPRIVGALNGQQVKVVRFAGEFLWHSHVDEDEMFLVVRGAFSMDYRDRSVDVQEGEFVIVPRGVEHRPVGEAECWVVLFEPESTLNTGNVHGARTIEHPDWV